MYNIHNLQTNTTRYRRVVHDDSGLTNTIYGYVQRCSAHTHENARAARTWIETGNARLGYENARSVRILTKSRTLDGITGTPVCLDAVRNREHSATKHKNTRDKFGWFDSENSQTDHENAREMRVEY